MKNGKKVYYFDVIPTNVYKRNFLKIISINLDWFGFIIIIY